MKIFRLAVPILLLFSPAPAQDTLKIMNWNLLNYVDASRDQYYRTVIRHVRPDVLVVQEMTSQAMDSAFHNNVLNLVFPGQFSKGTFIDGPDTDNGIYYKSSRFTFVANTPIRTALRDISEFKLFNALAADTIRLYSVHLKASNTTADAQKRAAEVDSLRQVTNSLPNGKYFAVMGDFNIYRSTESAYQKLLIDNLGDDGHCVDTIHITGTWNDSVYRPYHTQSTRTRSFGGGATGGLDDRFDMILFSRAIAQGDGRIAFVGGSMIPIGNDGGHYNDSINEMPNASVPDSVANALHYASDHLPLTAKFIFSPSTVTRQYAVNDGWNLLSLPLTVSDPRKVVLYPSSTSSAFAFNQASGYVVRDTLFNGVGYWLKFPSQQNISITGTARDRDSIAVLTGWNLIGMTSHAVQKDSIVQIPSGFVVSSYFGFNGSYTVADTLQPNTGYWIKVSQNGKLVLK